LLTRWAWPELRPQTLCGFAPGSGRNIYQATDSALFADAALWAATSAKAANQAHNITNGDCFRWLDVWPRIAEVFDMTVGDPAPMSLTDFMADKAPLWDAMVAKHGLAPYRLDEVVSWPFGDHVFNTTWDVMSNLTKSRLHGFHEGLDTEEMFVRLLRQFRAERIVP